MHVLVIMSLHVDYEDGYKEREREILWIYVRTVATYLAALLPRKIPYRPMVPRSFHHKKSKRKASIVGSPVTISSAILTLLDEKALLRWERKKKRKLSLLRMHFDWGCDISRRKKSFFLSFFLFFFFDKVKNVIYFAWSHFVIQLFDNEINYKVFCY